MMKRIISVLLGFFILSVILVFSSSDVQAVPTCDGMIGGVSCSIGNCALIDYNFGFTRVLSGVEARALGPYWCKDGFIGPYPVGGDCDGTGDFCTDNFGIPTRPFNDDDVVVICEGDGLDPVPITNAIFCITPVGGGGGTSPCPGGFTGSVFAGCHNPSSPPSNAILKSGVCANPTNSCYKCDPNYLYDSDVRGCYLLDSCADTDGGFFPDTKGTVSGRVNFVPYSNTDFCNNPSKLNEYSCAGDSSQVQSYVCQYGCSNGACNPKPPCSANLNTAGKTIKGVVGASTKFEIDDQGKMYLDGTVLYVAESQIAANGGFIIKKANTPVAAFDKDGNLRLLTGAVVNNDYSDIVPFGLFNIVNNGVAKFSIRRNTITNKYDVYTKSCIHEADNAPIVGGKGQN